MQVLLDKGQITFGENPAHSTRRASSLGKKGHVAQLGRDGEIMAQLLGCWSDSTQPWAK